jgi:hypothetical protein
MVRDTAIHVDCLAQNVHTQCVSLITVWLLNDPKPVEFLIQRTAVGEGECSSIEQILETKIRTIEKLKILTFDICCNITIRKNTDNVE